MSVASKSKSNGLSKATPIDDKNCPFHDEDHNTFFRKIQNADSFPDGYFLRKQIQIDRWVVRTIVAKITTLDLKFQLKSNSYEILETNFNYFCKI